MFLPIVLIRNVKNITKLNERELELGISGKSSWHNIYKNSAWVFIGGLDFELTEGDVIIIFSQYGEIVNINLVRDKTTGKSKGYAFLCYEDQRSTILAVDNLNGIKVRNRTIRVDHVETYRLPKEDEDIDDVTKRLYEEGCAPKLIETKVDSPRPIPSTVIKKESFKRRSRTPSPDDKERKRHSKKHKKSSHKSSRKEERSPRRKSRDRERRGK